MVPIVLLTGFLGSGKTTILNRSLRSPAFRSTVVIINEAGEIGLDHVLIERGGDDVYLLEGGCICCRAKGTLNATLGVLLRRRALDGLDFDRIIVETSGLAEPHSILHALLADPVFNRYFTLGGVVTVVDPVNLDTTIGQHPEALSQIMAADRLLVSKADMVDTARIAAVRTRLAALHPSADLHADPGVELRGDLVWVDPIVDAETSAGGFHAASVSGDIATSSLSFAGRLTSEGIDKWLDHVTELFGPKLLRLKGVLHISGLEDPVVLHAVQGLVYSPGTIGADRVTDNRVTLIASGIAEVDLSDALVRLRSVAA